MENGLAGCIKDTEVHGVGMQIDAAIIIVLFVVESHGAGSFSLRVSVYSKDTGWSGIWEGACTSINKIDRTENTSVQKLKLRWETQVRVTACYR